MEHQREQAAGLGLVRREPRNEAPEPDRFLGQAPTPRIRAGHVIPATAEGRVDGLEHRSEAERQLVGLRNLDADARVADLGLHADEPLSHGGGRDHERGRDPGRVEAQHGLQHERRPHPLLDRRMGADEEQREALVREGALRRGGSLRLVDHRMEGGERAGLDREVSAGVDQAPAGRGEEPGLRLLGHAVARPRGERRDEGVTQGVLCRGHVARAPREVRDQPAVRGPGRQLDGPVRVVRGGPAHITRLGRTSTTPVVAAGQRAAQSSAVSRSATSIS